MINFFNILNVLLVLRYSLFLSFHHTKYKMSCLFYVKTLGIVILKIFYHELKHLLLNRYQECWNVFDQKG